MPTVVAGGAGWPGEGGLLEAAAGCAVGIVARVGLEFSLDRTRGPAKGDGDGPPSVPGPLDELMGRYRHWMVADRRLAARTIRRYEQGARLFLASRAGQGGGPADVRGLSERAVTAFLLAEASRGLSAKSL